MRKKRVLSLLLAAAMAGTLLFGCGESKAPVSPDGGTMEAGVQALDTSKEVEIVMYILGTPPAKQDEIMADVNAKLKEKLNCTLKLNYISFAEYTNKYPLLFSSGEAFDMAYTATWLNFSSLAKKGAFKSVEELWPAYAPNNFAKATETAKKQSKIDGEMYCVPSLNKTYSAYGPYYRMDLVKDYGFEGPVEDFEDMEAYMDIIKEHYPTMEPLVIYSMGSEVDDAFMYFNKMYPVKGSQNDFLWLDPFKDNPEVFTYYEYEKTPEFLEMMSRWNEKGFYPKSALSDTDSQKFKSGKAAMGVHNVDAFVDNAIKNPDWDCQYTSFSNDISNLSFIQDAMVISNTAKNPERAMAVWDYLTTDEEMYNTFYYGILGKSYEVNDKQEVTMINTDEYAVSSMWAVRNSEFLMPSAGTPDSYGEMKAEWDAYIKEDQGAQKYRSLVIDTSAIETEYSACINAHQQYWWPLELGYKEPVEGLKEYKEMMEAAGIEKVKAEIQKQLDAYVAGLQ